MADFIPPGRLSGYKHGGKTFQVQTEYAPRPHPRVTTSVVLDGRTVHKVDHSWEEDIQSEDSRKNLETLLAEQHRQALELVKVRADDYIIAPPLPKDIGFPESSFRDSMVEVLGSLPFITAVYEFTEDGHTVFAHNFRDIFADWDREFRMLADLLSSFPRIVRVGSFRHGVCRFPAENLVLVTVHRRKFAIMMEPSGSIDDIWREFPELSEAVYA